MIAEAVGDPLFARQWADPADPGFRSFAVAALQLAQTAKCQPEERQATYRRIATEKRSRLLSESCGRAVAPGAVRLLAKTDWQEFNRRDWVALLTSPSLHALHHVERITPRLAWQLAFVPAMLLRPRVCCILNALTLPRSLWRRFSDAIERTGGDDRRALAAAARRVDGTGAFWDFYFLGVEGRARPLRLPDAAHDSRLLAPLASGDEMLAEGLRMHNCLAHLVVRAVAGKAIYFRSLDGPPLTAELTRMGAGWAPGRVLGTHNRPLSDDRTAHVRDELAAIAGNIGSSIDSRGCDAIEAFVAGLRQWACPRFSDEAIDDVEDALDEIRGRSLAWNNGAYAIFQGSSGGYIQFMADMKGDEYLCEIGSHKYAPELQAFLTASSVMLIERAGFLWPRGKNNFVRWFALSTPWDTRQLAELALAILAKVFRQPPGRPVHVKTHVP